MGTLIRALGAVLNVIFWTIGFTIVLVICMAALAT